MKAARDTDELLRIFSHKPELFLELQTDKANDITNNIKCIYDSLYGLSGNEFSEALPELLIDGFDEEQIWQQLELFNSSNIQYMLENVAKFSIKSSQINFTAKKKFYECKTKENLSDFLQYDANLNSAGETASPDDINADDTLNQSDNEDISDHEDDANCLSDDALKFGEIESGDESEEEKMLKKLLDDVVQEEDHKSDSEMDTDEEGSKNESLKNQKDITVSKPSVIDDQFFSLQQMEKFCDIEDAKEMSKNKRNDESESDAMSLDEEDEEGRDVMYSEFFDSPEGHQKDEEEDISDGGDNESNIRNDDESMDEMNDDVNQVENSLKDSNFEKRQKKMKMKIAEMESSAVSIEKPWQLKGEVTAQSRPENSLLQEDLDFDHTTRKAPAITEETTKNLEDLIIQRIRDKIFDDVERKVKPSEEMPEFRKRIVLDQEKSKKSLADIYEEEYLKQQQKDEDEKNDPQHEEIKKSMQALFIKLDALSHFYFSPKLSNPEVQIISNMPSISMEEVAPVTVTDAACLAPHEIKKSAKGDMVGETERTSTDKKRARRQKKIRQKEIEIAKEKKENLKKKNASDSGVIKKKTMSELKKEVKSGSDKMKNVKLIEETTSSNLTSSSQFFSQLQDEVSLHIQSKKAKKQTESKSKKSAFDFKL